MLRTFTVCLLLFLVGNASAFVKKSRPFVRSTTSSTLGLIDTAMSDSIAAANSLLVSTIDSDIANISTDQFGLVFAGGIVSDSDDHYFRSVGFESYLVLTLARSLVHIKIIMILLGGHDRKCPVSVNGWFHVGKG